MLLAGLLTPAKINNTNEGMKILYFTLFAIIISGCLAKMEKVTEDTMVQVKKSVDQMENMEKATLLSNAVNCLKNPPEILNDHVSCALTVIVSEAKIEDGTYWLYAKGYQYLGIRRPMQEAMINLDDTNDGNVSFPNVTFVSPDGSEYKKMGYDLTTISEKRLLALEIVTSRLIYDLIKKSSGAINEEQASEWASRLVYITTAIYGAKRISQIENKGFYRETKPFPAAYFQFVPNNTFLGRLPMASLISTPMIDLAKIQRDNISKQLVKLATKLNLKETRPEAYDALKSHLEIKLQDIQAAQQLN